MWADEHSLEVMATLTDEQGGAGMGIFSSKPNVEQMIRKKDIKGLMQALDNKKEVVRLNAAFGLALVGDASALEPFVRTLRNADLSVPEEKRPLLAQLDFSRTEYVAPFINTLKAGDFKARWGGAKILASVGGAAAVESLIRLLEDQEWGVRGLAIVILGEIGLPAVEPLALALGDKNREVRRGAAMALGIIGDASVRGALQGACEDSDSTVRKAAEEALASIEARASDGR